MPLFSERYNLVEKTKLQINFLEQGTRVLLWNEFVKIRNSYLEGEYYKFCQYIWSCHLKKTLDDMPYNAYSRDIADGFIKEIFLSGKYEQIFDIIEIAINKFGFYDLIEDYNKIFEAENCAYRFVDEYIIEITSDVEIQEVEEVINTNTKNIVEHIKQALEHLSNRQNPDYRNSIKEAISAVEAFCRNITGESTLDKALKKLESKGVVFNPQLKQGLEKIYHYTNGKDGIRHALMDGTTPPAKADAKFMLVMCSAFINYIRENGING